MPKEKIDMIIEGGKASPTPAVAQKLGPMKINISEVMQKINEKTSSFKGIKVPVKIIVDTISKKCDISVGSPPTTELIKKELSLEKGAGEPNKNKIANISIEQVIKIAKMKKDSMFANSLKAAVKTVAGSCSSLGTLIEGKTGSEINKDIDSGLYDSLIKAEKIDVSPEKAGLLKTQLIEVQEKLKKEIEKLKKEEEELKGPAKEEVAVAEEAKEGAEIKEGEEKKGAEKGKEAPKEAKTLTKEEKPKK